MVVSALPRPGPTPTAPHEGPRPVRAGHRTPRRLGRRPSAHRPAWHGSARHLPPGDRTLRRRRGHGRRRGRVRRRLDRRRRPTQSCCQRRGSSAGVVRRQLPRSRRRVHRQPYGGYAVADRAGQTAVNASPGSHSLRRGDPPGQPPRQPRGPARPARRVAAGRRLDPSSHRPVALPRPPRHRRPERPDPGLGIASARAPRPHGRRRARLGTHLPPAGPRRRAELAQPHRRSRAMTPLNTLPRSLLWPPEPGKQPPGWSQSLAKGAVGTALLHIERAHAGTGSWQTAHTWLAAATSSEITGGPTTGLFFGAPAVAYALHTANRCAPGRYERTLAALDHSITNTTRLRLDRAHARIDRAAPARFAEWDLIYGRTGIGAYLLRRDPYSPLLRDVLSYLVRLTEPLHLDGQALPGWWTHTDPTGAVSPQFPGGHGNLGIAHGITGPLALLSLAPRHGVNVDGHSAAVARICTWLDTWRQDSDTGPWWPRWIT